MRAAIAAAIGALAAGPAAGDISLGLPVDCVPGHDCHVQHLVDRDPGPGVRDYTCGRLSYDGHKGTDFALPSLSDMTRGVAVLAAAPGVVRATRDGMRDVAMTAATEAAIAGRECGNGVVISHADGWESQYCHLAQGSVAVRQGDRVARGAALGRIGLSGRTQFPHLHFTLRRDGVVIDPFAPDPAADCGAGTMPDLWDSTPPAPPGGLIGAGFSDHVPDYDAVKAGEAARTGMPAQADGLVLFAYAYGGLAGDRISLDIAGPGGTVMTREVVLDRDQAQFFRAAGRRLSGPRWSAGTYAGVVRLIRDGQVMDERRVSVELR